MKNYARWIAFILLLVFSAGSAFAAGCGKISSLRGHVDILRVKTGQGGVSNPVREGILAKAGMKLECSDIIVTERGARAKVRLIGAVLTVAPQTRFHVAGFATKTHKAELLELTFGKLRSLFEGHKKKSGKKDHQTRFRIKTPAAVVGVRGTDFFVSYDPGTKVTEQATLTGVVEVTQRGTKHKVMVRPGQQVEVENFIAKVKEKLMREKADSKAPLTRKARHKIMREVEAQLKPVVVEKIGTPLKTQIRETSVMVRNDKKFTTRQAVEILGKPSNWKAPKKTLPGDFDKMKNEF